MKDVLFPALAGLHNDMILRAKADQTGSAEEAQANAPTEEAPTEEATTGEAAAPASEAKLPGRKVFTDETVAEIRALRAEKREDGKPMHSHAALAKRFDTTPGAISHIVRNRTYKNPNYVPTNDGV